MYRTQIYLPKMQRTKLRAAARTRSTTVSHVVRTFIDQGLAGNGTAPPMHKQAKTMFDVLAEIKKRGVKGPRDLAKNMDKYLYGAV
jgi:hypothetical protein